MNTLYIYPTSRAIRKVREGFVETEGFLPTLMRMDEFEARAVLVENRRMADRLERVLLLKEAADFKNFDRMKIDRDTVRFFTKSDAIFKFFEELSAEGVTLEALAEADAYAEFDTHLAVLAELRDRYEKLLHERGMTDRMFIPENYVLNIGFISGYERIEIYLEGYLSRFELQLLQKVSEHTEVIVHYATSRFTRKMQERFDEMGISLNEDEAVSFSIGGRMILASRPARREIKADVYRVEEREEQVALAFVQIERMVRSGISPEEIVLILPDESFKTHLMLFDHLNNLNFAMGYDYAEGRIVKSLEALYGFWQKRDEKSIAILRHYGLNEEKVLSLSSEESVAATDFFAFLDEIGLCENAEQERVKERYTYFTTLFKEARFTYRIWLFLWLRALLQITIDDVRGGKVTVMGVLETRGVSFKGVVIVDFNEGVVPASSNKDIFLNSSVRAFAGLPTRQDREALQKQYYYKLLQHAEKSAIIYSASENGMPSKFLYELGLSEAKPAKAPFEILYPQPSRLQTEVDPEVSEFDAFAQTWSPSRLKIFLECKRKYYYRYIRNINAKEDKEFNEGAFLHNLLEHLYKERDHYDDERELAEKLHRLMDELLPDTDAVNRYRKLLWREKLKGFVQEEIAHFKNGWRVVAKEVEVFGEIGGLKFKGRIDRIDQNATDTLVLDYKSGKVEKEPKKLNPEKITDFQMSIYHALLKGQYQNLSLAYVKILENGQKQQVTMLDEREALLGEHIAMLKQTESFTAHKCESLQTCQYCEFALMCGRGEYL